MKYKDIADRIISDIQNEKLASGQRMPSLRQLTKQLGVSMTTALNSYRTLEDLGWLVSYPKSGFYVSAFSSNENLPELPQFKSRKMPVSISNRADSYDDKNHTSGPFGISQVCPDNIPLSEIKAHIRQTVQRGDALLHTYPNPKGSISLRDALATHFSNNGFPLSAKELCISSGCMDAIRMAVLATTEVGDAVGISSPCFNGLLKLLASMSRKAVEIPCTPEGLDLDQIEQRLKNKEISAGLFSSSFMNPHGISLSIEQKQRLANLANKYRTPIIEDDVYGELGHESLYPLPVKHWDTHGYVIWCSSISKTLSSGLRIGWCAPGRYLDKCIDICASERGEEDGFEFMKNLHANINQYTKSGSAPIKAAGRGENTIGIVFMHDAVKQAVSGFPIKVVAPAEGTGYEIGSMSIIDGARNMDEAQKFYDWALSTDAQNLALQVNAFQVPSNTGAETSESAPDMSSIKLIDYDFKTYGSSDTRKRLLKKWDDEVSVLPQ